MQTFFTSNNSHFVMNLLHWYFTDLWSPNCRPAYRFYKQDRVPLTRMRLGRFARIEKEAFSWDLCSISRFGQMFWRRRAKQGLASPHETPGHHDRGETSIGWAVAALLFPLQRPTVSSMAVWEDGAAPTARDFICFPMLFYNLVLQTNAALCQRDGSQRPASC